MSETNIPVSENVAKDYLLDYRLDINDHPINVGEEPTAIGLYVALQCIGQVYPAGETRPVGDLDAGFAKRLVAHFWPNSKLLTRKS